MLTYMLKSFLTLFILFVLTLELAELNTVNPVEIIFMVYALGTLPLQIAETLRSNNPPGFALEKLAAMQEHGVSVYFTGTWVSLLCESVLIDSLTDSGRMGSTSL